jgi:hypothetical protein
MGMTPYSSYRGYDVASVDPIFRVDSKAVKEIA